ncbi:uncharacterized protein F5Z01DRAFT_493788 [Emericellopsis atlantica]|uniref:Uncharacterized protein n=1 Tax=Emericellopsis atlantica TaxID=2614577 RepID=A0A9P8CJP8_9HYPO|nr:uncharacterized protein F5Z01DRAFT_493788 [Emericellopsis atlantica]KAG9249568.1 hypothetical protein F5Z01DRAFT_493788 [Emericellopsis atlantica]
MSDTDTQDVRSFLETTVSFILLAQERYGPYHSAANSLTAILNDSLTALRLLEQGCAVGDGAAFANHTPSMSDQLQYQAEHSGSLSQYPSTNLTALVFPDVVRGQDDGYRLMLPSPPSSLRYVEDGSLAETGDGTVTHQVSHDREMDRQHGPEPTLAADHLEPYSPTDLSDLVLTNVVRDQYNRRQLAQEVGYQNETGATLGTELAERASDINPHNVEAANPTVQLGDASDTSTGCTSGRKDEQQEICTRSSTPARRRPRIYFPVELVCIDDEFGVCHTRLGSSRKWISKRSGQHVIFTKGVPESSSVLLRFAESGERFELRYYDNLYKWKWRGEFHGEWFSLERRSLDRVVSQSPQQRPLQLRCVLLQKIR